MPFLEAINSGAETVGCNVQTARRYLDKLTSRAGPLSITTGDTGTSTLHKKPKP